MERHLIATGAEFVEFHLIRMASLIPGRDVILFTADRAFQDDVVSL
jgi:hypothetical protein